MADSPRGIQRLLLSAALLLALGLALAGASEAGRRRGGGGGGGSIVHDDVLVVVNDQVPISVDVGEYYRQKRNIPTSNVVTLDVNVFDPTLSNGSDQVVNRGEFERDIRDPIASFLTDNGLKDQIRFIVLAKGVPLRIAGGGTCDASQLTYLRDCTKSSVSAELALLFSGLDGAPGIEGMANPFYDSKLSFPEFRSQNPDAPLRYIVTRLDGYQEPIDEETGVPVDVKALIDRGSAAAGGGTMLVDEDPGQAAGRQPGNLALLGPAAAQLDALSVPLVHETTTTFASDVEDIAGYASWGSNDSRTPGEPFYGTIDGKTYPGSFAPRAIAVDLVSSNARGFVYPPSYGQSRLADLVRNGVAGAAGNVFEPFLLGLTRPDELFYHHARTSRLAGVAYYKSVPYLGWMNTYVGDPLLRPPYSPAATDDRDGDGVLDGSDNCVTRPNPAQRDTNADGYGNLCDPDVNGDGLVDTSWGATVPPKARGDWEEVAITIQNGGFVEDQDLDGDGDVDLTDLSLLELQLFQPPGPSGVAP